MMVWVVDCQKILHCAIQHTRFYFSKCCMQKYPTIPANCRKFFHFPSMRVIHCFFMHYINCEPPLRLECQDFLQPTYMTAGVHPPKPA